MKKRFSNTDFFVWPCFMFRVHFISSLLEREPHQSKSPPAGPHMGFSQSKSLAGFFCWLREARQQVDLPVAVLPVWARRSVLRFGRSGCRRTAVIRAHSLRSFGRVVAISRLPVLILRLADFQPLSCRLCYG